MIASNLRRIEPSAFSLEEAAVYSGLSYAAIKRLIRTGKLPHSKVDREIVIRRAAIDRFLHDSQVATNG